MKMYKQYEVSSEICIKTKLCVPLSHIKSKLECNPSLKCIRNGSELRFAFFEKAKSNVHFELAVSASSLSIILFSKSSPVYFFKEALLRLFSIAAILKNEMQFEISSIFPYMVHVLASSELKIIPRNKQSLPQTDIILAKRISLLAKENLALQSRVNLLEDQLSHAICAFSAAKSQRGVLLRSELCNECGIGPLEVEKYISQAGKFGYITKEVGNAIQLVKE